MKATVQFAKGKINVSMVGKETQVFDAADAQKAFELAESWNQEAEPKTRGPISIDLTYRGAFEVRATDSTISRYPLMSMTADQFNTVRSNWETICKAFDANRSKIASSYAALRPAVKDGDKPKGERVNLEALTAEVVKA
jgi:hypothetical protein